MWLGKREDSRGAFEKRQMEGKVSESITQSYTDGALRNPEVLIDWPKLHRWLACNQGRRKTRKG